MKKLLLFVTVFLCMGLNKNYAQTTIFTENFETQTYPTIPTSWSQNQTDTGARWKCGTSTILASSYFAVPAHTTYCAINDDKDSSTHNLHDTIMSPVINASTYANVFLSFDFAYLGGTYGGHNESFNILASTNGGSTWTTVATLTANTVSFWETKYINLAAIANSSNAKIAFVYSDGGGWEYGAAIDNIKLFAPLTTDLSLTAITPAAGDPTAYALTSGSVALGGTVQNLGINAVTSYTVTYQVGAAAPVISSPISANIAPLATGNFSGINMTLPSTVGNAPVKVWVTLSGDLNATNDSANTGVGAAAFMPTKRLVIEEATGTWCGWCVRGIVYMDSLRTLHGNNVGLIAVHNADPMTNTAYDSWATSFPGFSGFPSVIIDRRELDDPSNLLTIYNNESNYFGFADITTSNAHVSGTTYTDTVVIKPAMDYSGDYRVILAVTEEQVHSSVTGGTWDQHNYYSSQSQNQALTGQGWNYQTLPSVIPATSMYYNHVARVASPSPAGSANLPASMTNNTNYTVVLNATLDPTWVVNNLVGVVMLVRGSDGVVLNSKNIGNPWVYTAITNVNQSIDKVLVFPNPANNVAYVNFELAETTNVTINVTDMVGHVVYNEANANMESGNHKILIDTKNFAAGLYNVTVSTVSGSTTQKLSVIK